MASWLKYFPREQIYINSSEEIFANTSEVFNSIVKFLEIDEWIPAKFKNSNPGDYQVIDPDTKNKLGAYFKPYNQDLYDLLGVDYKWDEN